MLLSTMPTLAVSCSRKVICSLVKAETEASSITAFTWLSNSTGITMTFCGVTLNMADPIGVTFAGISVMRRRRLSAAHCPISPSPIGTAGGAGAHRRPHRPRAP